ncbi:MAG: hypothetical protein H7Z43_09205 [Clostridia bacterium]|nr:hypothetical protein [Deltaproteobacteria bacterium]
MSRLVSIVLAVLAVGCSRDPTANDAKKLLTVDQDLTLSTFFGGDVGLAVGYDCQTIGGPVTATSRGVVLASIAMPEPIQFGGNLRFLVSIPAAKFADTSFGNPTVVPVTIGADCDGRPAISNPYTVTYVRPSHSGVAPSGVSRVWSSDAENEILACDGASLVRYSLSPLDGDLTPPVEIERLELGFACTLGELRGDVGGRRYFVVDRGGIAAIDPGPALAWVAPPALLFYGLSARTDEDPILVYQDPGSPSKQVVVLSKTDGSTILGPLPLQANPYDATPPNSVPTGAVARSADGSISVLTFARQGVENIYFIERFDTAGAAIGTPVQVVRYGRQADGQSTDLPYAEFSYDGSRLYFSNNDGTDLLAKWVASIALADGRVTRLTTLDSGGNGYRDVIGEAYGRLLVASEQNFIWLDTMTGDPLSSSFAPDSARRFYRLRVESDGSTVMLADTTGTGSGGFYVFDSNGLSLVRINGDDTSFSWLAGGPGGGSLIVVADPTGNEVHDLGPAASFVAVP